MYQFMTRNELKNMVPHGCGKIIAEKAGVSQRSVSLFLNGKNNSYKVEKAVLETLAELKTQQKELLEKIV